MSEKPKVRMVIGTGLVNRGCYDSINMTRKIDVGDFPDGTEIEIVALLSSDAFATELGSVVNSIHSEPKRELVQGPGEWSESTIMPGESLLISGNKEIGRVGSVGINRWWWNISTKGGETECCEAAQRAVEEAKADAGEDGFRWEEVLVAECEDCGRNYADDGFQDLVLPNDVWAKISSTGDENGLLCPSCIVARCVKAGIECKAMWRSGPFYQDEEVEEEKAEPEYIQYDASRIRNDGSFTHEYVTDPRRALGLHNGHKSLRSTTLAVLSAQDEQLRWHELDRYEAEEEKNK